MINQIDFFSENPTDLTQNQPIKQTDQEKDMPVLGKNTTEYNNPLSNFVNLLIKAINQNRNKLQVNTNNPPNNSINQDFSLVSTKQTGSVLKSTMFKVQVLNDSKDITKQQYQTNTNLTYRVESPTRFSFIYPASHKVVKNTINNTISYTINSRIEGQGLKQGWAYLTFVNFKDLNLTDENQYNNRQKQEMLIQQNTHNQCFNLTKFSIAFIGGKDGLKGFVEPDQICDELKYQYLDTTQPLAYLIQLDETSNNYLLITGGEAMFHDLVQSLNFNVE